MNPHHRRQSRLVDRVRRACVAGCLASVGACSRDAAAHPEQSVLQAKVEEISDTSLLMVPRAERFAVAPVDTLRVPDRLSGTCVIGPDVNRTVPVNALGAGRVVDVRASLGDRVHKGQTLVTISSPDLSSALADHLKAVADEALAHRQLDRARLLLDHGSIAQKDLESAEDVEQKAQVDVRASLDRVRMLGGDPAQTTPVIDLTSPIDGTIVEQNVTRSAGVKSPDSAPNLFTIADLSRVWVLCDVYENDLARAHMGQSARITLNAYPERAFTGQIGNISQMLDPSTRTAKVRIELENRDGFMRPGMFAVAELESPASEERLVLPTTALVQLHDADWVFVRVGPNAFRRTQVRAGREVAPGLQEILSGVVRGQVVVRNALQFVQTMEQ
ncbi:MAG TPA: efflux RND transporter periplasmic adaptor subunit [Gemmatimonadaceae bacterium]